MNVVMIAPTGIGLKIGGHAGDAAPVSKMLASLCDNLIVHPNVVFGSDLNEMTENTLLVEGSSLNRFLRGEIGLKKVHYNKILLVVNKPVPAMIINSANAAIANMGADIRIMELDRPLIMRGGLNEDGVATSSYEGVFELLEQVKDVDFDALAINTDIEVGFETKLEYFRSQSTTGINPWGKVEADVSKIISEHLNKPVAHGPTDDLELDFFKEEVDPRMAAEVVSISFIHCVFKGLHKAPKIGQAYKEITNKDIDFMVSPIDCYGDPHGACGINNIPIIFVEENEPAVINTFNVDGNIIVKSYLEAAGIIAATKAGIDWRTTKRPLATVEVY